MLPLKGVLQGLYQNRMVSEDALQSHCLQPMQFSLAFFRILSILYFWFEKLQLQFLDQEAESGRL